MSVEVYCEIFNEKSNADKKIFCVLSATKSLHNQALLNLKEQYYFNKNVVKIFET